MLAFMLWEKCYVRNLVSTDVQGVGTWSGAFLFLKMFKAFSAQAASS